MSNYPAFPSAEEFMCVYNLALTLPLERAIETAQASYGVGWMNSARYRLWFRLLRSDLRVLLEAVETARKAGVLVDTEWYRDLKLRADKEVTARRLKRGRK